MKSIHPLVAFKKKYQISLSRCGTVRNRNGRRKKKFRKITILLPRSQLVSIKLIILDYIKENVSISNFILKKVVDCVNVKMFLKHSNFNC